MQQQGESSRTRRPHLTEDFEYDNPPVRARQPPKATRRIRGEIACAECRRLKIRCDRTVPCSTCRKRGCSALCPNGTIPPGEGSRFVLAATDHLRRKLARMEARMHSLEDATAIIHATTSDRPHPLLAAPEEEGEEEESILKPVVEESSQSASALVDALGTLHIDERGASRFFGASGGSESLLLKAKDLEGRSSSKTTRPHLQELDPSYLPPEINNCYQSFPFTPPGIQAAPVQSMIEKFLPSMERAVALCNTFLEHLSWMFQIVTRRQMINELIPIIYKQRRAPYGPHDLALMLIVLGIGSLVDMTLQPYNLEAQHYYKLARATLALQPVLAEQSVVTIKVIHLMSIYNGMSGKESNLEQSYTLLDLAGQVALRIGFHIDPSSWQGFEGKEAYERRVYFWNLMSAVLWQSLVTGRPPSLLSSFVDCKIPTPMEESIYQQGEVPLGFGVWGFRASVECLIPLVKATLAIKPPTYESILELDQKIRKFALPRSDEPRSDDTVSVSMQAFVRAHYIDLMLLFLHRGFFAQAMTQNPTNPLQSPYGKSVWAAYSSACAVLETTKIQFLKQPDLVTRIWRIWSLAFTAAVIVGTVAIRGIHLNLKPPALGEFESAFQMFQSAAETSSRAARAMPVLQIMLQKAFQALKRYQERRELTIDRTHPDDELSIFAGQVRLMNPEQPFSSPVLPPISSRSAGQRKRNEQHLLNPPHIHPTAYTHHQPAPLKQPPPLNQMLAVNQLPSAGSNTIQPTFAQLSGGWNGLFHEVPEPSFGLPVNTGPHHSYNLVGDGAMLDDRWASFMHNYNILEDPVQSAQYHY